MFEFFSLFSRKSRRSRGNRKKSLNERPVGAERVPAQAGAPKESRECTIVPFAGVVHLDYLSSTPVVEDEKEA